MHEKIIKGAFELFTQCGIRSVTMSDIASHLGISKRTIYEEFNDKTELLEGVISYMQTCKRKISKKILDESQSCIIGILSIMKYVLDDNFQSQPKFTFYFDLKKYYPQLTEKAQQYRRTQMLNVAVYLQKGVDQKTVRSNLNLELVSTLFVAQIEGLDVLYTNLRKYHPKEIFTTIILSFCRGISTEKGLKEIEDFITENKL